MSYFIIYGLVVSHTQLNICYTKQMYFPIIVKMKKKSGRKIDQLS